MVESQSIYKMLENEVVPLFYTRTADNLPRAWIKRMKNSIKWITPRFNTNRMVLDYTRHFYMPAGSRWRYLTDNAMERAKAFSSWKANVQMAWPELSIKDVKLQIGNSGDNGDNGQLHPSNGQLKVGSELRIKALVSLGRIGPDDVSIELYYGPVDSWGNIKDGSTLKMDCDGSAGFDGDHWFTGVMPCKKSGRMGLAVRVLPKHADLTNPHELGLILWETQTERASVAAG